MDDTSLTYRICELLGKLPGWQWSTTDAYTNDRVGIFYGPIPHDHDLAVGVRVYGRSDVGEVRQRRVQVRSRGAAGDLVGAEHLSTLLTAVLTGSGRMPGISGITHLSFAPLGADTSGREERTDNFVVTLDNLEAL